MLDDPHEETNASRSRPISPETAATQAELNRKAETEEAKANAARDRAIEAAQNADEEPPNLEPLAREARPRRGLARKADGTPTLTMDAGDWSEENAKSCGDQGIDATIATGRLPHGQPPPPKRGPLPRDADDRTRMARKLRSKTASAIDAQPKTSVETVNEQIKEVKGRRRFLLRSLEKVDGEWHLIGATHNLLKLFRDRRSQQQMLAAATASG